MSDTGTITVTTYASSVSINATNITLAGRTCASCTNGGTTTPSATVTYADGLTGSAVSWSSGNASVASVNSGTGLITGVTHGTTSITATSTLPDATVVSPTASSSVNVTVTTYATSVSLNPSSATLAGRTCLTCTNGGTTTITPTVSYADGTTGSGATWASANTSIATVNSGGLVQGVSHGSTVVTATSTTNGSTIIGSAQSSGASITVTTYATSVILNPANVSVLAGNSTTLSATVYLADGSSETSVTWSSSNTSVASVNSSGVVTTYVSGTATIYATSTRTTSVYGTATVGVTSAVSSVTISPGYSTTVYTERWSGWYTATVNLSDGTTESNLTWYATDSAQVTLNVSGTQVQFKPNYPSGTNVCARSNRDTSKQACISVSIVQLAVSSFSMSIDNSYLDAHHGPGSGYPTNTTVRGTTYLNDGSSETNISSWSIDNTNVVYFNSTSNTSANIYARAPADGIATYVRACAARNTGYCSYVWVGVRGCKTVTTSTCCTTGTCYQYNSCCSTDIWGACVANSSCPYSCCTAYCTAESCSWP